MYLSFRCKAGTTRNSDINVVQDRFRIAVVNMSKYLGMLINNTLNLVPPVDVLSMKIDKKVVFLDRATLIYHYLANVLFLVLSCFLKISIVRRC